MPVQAGAETNRGRALRTSNNLCQKFFRGTDMVRFLDAAREIRSADRVEHAAEKILKATCSPQIVKEVLASRSRFPSATVLRESRIRFDIVSSLLRRRYVHDEIVSGRHHFRILNPDASPKKGLELFGTIVTEIVLGDRVAPAATSSGVEGEAAWAC